MRDNLEVIQDSKKTKQVHEEKEDKELVSYPAATADSQGQTQGIEGGNTAKNKAEWGHMNVFPTGRLAKGQRAIFLFS